MAHKYYAVRRGRTPGIYNSWPQCQAEITNFPHARYKSFLTKEEAEEFLHQSDYSDNYTSDSDLVAPIRNGAIVVYTDGGSRNHGNVRGGHVQDNDKAAWAYLIIMPNGTNHSDAGCELGSTNNRMEIMAALNALQVLVQNKLNNNQIDIVADSKYVLDSITKNWLYGWVNNGWKTKSGNPVKNMELWKKMYELLKEFPDLKWHWTKGHAEDSGNVFVDKKLNDAMDRMGESGTINVARPRPENPAPHADQDVRDNALNRIDDFLKNGSSGAEIDKNAPDHPLSKDESVDNIKDMFNKLKGFDDNDK